MSNCCQLQGCMRWRQREQRQACALAAKLPEAEELDQAPEPGDVRRACHHEQVLAAGDENRQARQRVLDIILVNTTFVNPKERLTSMRAAERLCKPL